MPTQQEINSQQYGDKSTAYLTSSVHSQGIEFDKIKQLLSQTPTSQVLDLGCGAGHVTYHVAPLVEQVIAYDLTPTMVEIVIKQSQLKGLNNVKGIVGCAEHLPFENHHFDMVISRFSAHHWQHIGLAMTEIFRVLKPQGQFILIDTLGHDNPILDTFLQSIEVIRDPSHVRDYSLAEWGQMIGNEGFKIKTLEIQALSLDFQSWVARMQTPAYAVETIRYLQNKANDNIQQHFSLKANGDFASEVLYLVAIKPI